MHSDHSKITNKACLYGIGVGPGDPDLITVKGLKTLQSVQLVAYPAPDTGDSLVYQIAKPHIPEHIEKLAIIIPMQPKRDAAIKAFDTACEKLSSYLETGHNIAVLCEGDPFFYGSFMYIYKRLKHKFHCEVIPGVSSFVASAAALGQPLAHRNDRVTILPATLDDQTLLESMMCAETVVLIKIGRHWPRISRLLQSLNQLNNTKIVTHATMDHQKIIPATLAEDITLPYFSIAIITDIKL